MPLVKKPQFEDRDQLLYPPQNRLQPNRADRLAIDIGLPDRRYLEDDMKGRSEWFSSMAQRVKSLLYQSDGRAENTSIRNFGRYEILLCEFIVKILLAEFSSISFHCAMFGV